MTASDITTLKKNISRLGQPQTFRVECWAQFFGGYGFDI